LAEQAKILVAEAEENNWNDERTQTRWGCWDTCSLCEQAYHGVVACALGWGCWKTYLRRPETDVARRAAMEVLGNGLSYANHHEDALSVREADLAMRRRLCTEEEVLAAQANLANTYDHLERWPELALPLRRDVYSGYVKLFGEEHEQTLTAALNYATTLVDLQRLKEAKSLMRKKIPVARRVLGESDRLTLKMRWGYALALYLDTDATLDDLRESVNTLEDTTPTARRVLGGEHPTTAAMEITLRKSRAKLRAREDAEPDVSAQELDTAEAAAAAAVAAAAIKKRQRRDTIERERSRRRTG